MRTSEDNILELYKELHEAAAKGEKALLATVVSSKGSAPRKAGAKMLIRQDGSFIGTIGGGGVEEKVKARAADIISSGQPEIMHFDMSGSGREAEMVCGGQIDVFLEPLQSPETLYLFGAGHIAWATAEIGKKLGFRVVVIDPRPDYNNRERFPSADELIVEDFSSAFSKLSVAPDGFIVIYTTGHVFDEDCLEFALGTSARYIGMIGSKRKVLDVAERLRHKGVPSEKLKQVHAPIGIEIGAETPEEIAVSILAEIIRIKRTGK